ncbi:MAG: branched-chain amino acid ABC transporter permease [Fimbriimonadaceae bacterium]
MDFSLHLVAAFDLTTLPQQLVNGLLNGAIYALIALGYTMVYGVLKLINFAHGEVFMLGAYGALFVSWYLGYRPDGASPPASYLTLILMLLGSMLVCTVAAFFIERFAYRPMRSQPRIASLITAIGLSLLLQYSAQIFLLNGTPQTIQAGKLSPFVGNVTLNLRGPDQAKLDEAEKLKPSMTAAAAAFKARLPLEKGEFDLSPEGKKLQEEMRVAERKYNEAVNAGTAHAVKIAIPKGQVVLFVTTIFLMAMLTYLVMFTKQGRAMRAVSHDFNAASLMGINIDNVIVFTFLLGSALAGAGAMMYCTFIPGTKIDAFTGLTPGVKAFTAAVLGGIGNIPGAVLGGLVMGVAEYVVVWAGYDSYRDAIAFVILIIVLLFHPGGLLGSSKVEKV